MGWMTCMRVSVTLMIFGAGTNRRIQKFCHHIYITPMPLFILSLPLYLVSIYLSFLHAPSTQFCDLDIISSIIESVESSFIIDCQCGIYSGCDASPSISSKTLHHWVINLSKGEEIHALEEQKAKLMNGKKK